MEGTDLGSRFFMGNRTSNLCTSIRASIRTFIGPEIGQSPFMESCFETERDVNSSHRYSVKVEDVVAEHVKYSRQQSDDSEWKIVEDDGEMKVFIRETEMDGVTCDPIKATTVVNGVSAYEICSAFFVPDFRMLWETTLDVSNVIETLDQDTLLFHQKHKKVWPAAQRDTVALTHIRSIKPEEQRKNNKMAHRMSNCEGEEDEDEDEIPLDWITVNFSVFDMEDEIPCGKCVRAKINGSMLCRTRIRSKDGSTELFLKNLTQEQKNNLTRDQLKTTVVYQSYVDAGGWVPSAGVRALAKKEYPRFVRKFSDFVKVQNKDKDICLQSST